MNVPSVTRPRSSEWSPSTASPTERGVAINPEQGCASSSSTSSLSSQPTNAPLQPPAEYWHLTQSRYGNRPSSSLDLVQNSGGLLLTEQDENADEKRRAEQRLTSSEGHWNGLDEDDQDVQDLIDYHQSQFGSDSQLRLTFERRQKRRRLNHNKVNRADQQTSSIAKNRQRSAKGTSTLANRLQRRQAQGYPDCTLVGNSVLSCYPTEGTTLVQGVWSKFIWNDRYPTFIGVGAVDIYLYHADSETVATTYLGIENARGSIGIRPDDTWWANQTSWNEGQNVTWPYFFVIVDAGVSLTGGEPHQSTFSAIQTAAPATLVASLASASSAASASSVSSVASASRISASSARAQASQNSLQSSGDNDNSGGGVPHWAIAVIVVLAFLALVGAAVATYFCIGRMRKRRNSGAVARDGSMDGHSGVDSKDPIMAEAGAGPAGLSGSAAIAGANQSRRSPSSLHRPVSDSVEHSGPTASSAGGDYAPSSSGSGPITSTDAARMAEAFRLALRKPEFPSADASVHTPSPGEEGDVAGVLGGGGRGGEILDHELRSEGKSLRSVSGGKTWGP